MFTDPNGNPLVDSKGDPTFIGRTAYSGRWQRTGVPANLSVASVRASKLSSLAGGDEIAIWEFSGHLRNGKPLFCRTRVRAGADGNLLGFDSNGQRTIIHPADRVIKILVQR